MDVRKQVSELHIINDCEGILTIARRSIVRPLSVPVANQHFVSENPMVLIAGILSNTAMRRRAVEKFEASVVYMSWSAAINVFARRRDSGPSSTQCTFDVLESHFQKSSVQIQRQMHL